MDDPSYSQKNTTNNPNHTNRNNNNVNESFYVEKKKNKKRKKTTGQSNGSNNRRGRGGYGKRFNNEGESESRGSNPHKKKKHTNKRKRGGYRGGAAGNYNKNEDYYNNNNGEGNTSREYHNSNQGHQDYIKNKMQSSINDIMSGTETPRSINSNYVKSSQKGNFNGKRNYERSKYDENDGQYKMKSQMKGRDFRKGREHNNNNEYYSKKGSNRKNNKTRGDPRRKPGKFKKHNNNEDYQKNSYNNTGKNSFYANSEYESKKTIPVTNPSNNMPYEPNNQESFPEVPTPGVFTDIMSKDSYQKMSHPAQSNASITNSRANPIPHNSDNLQNNHTVNIPRQKYYPQGGQIPLEKDNHSQHNNFDLNDRRRSHQQNQNYNNYGDNYGDNYKKNNYDFNQDKGRYKNEYKNNNNDYKNNNDFNNKYNKFQKKWNNNNNTHQDNRFNNYNQNSHHQMQETLHPNIPIFTRTAKKYLWGINKNYFISKKMEDYQPYVSYEEAKDLIVQEKAFRGRIHYGEKLNTLGIIESEDFVKKVYANVRDCNRTVEGCEVIFMPVSPGWQKYLYANYNEEKETQELERIEQTELESERRICLSSDFKYYSRQKYMNEEDLKLEKTKVKVKVIYVEKNPLTERNIIVKIRKIIQAGLKEYAAVYIYDERYPQFSVDFSVPNPLINKSDTYSYYLAKYAGWSESERFPKVQLLEPLGKIGFIKSECESLLKQFDIPAEKYHKNFTEEILKNFSVDEKNELIIDEDMTRGRTDLSQKVIFTVGYGFEEHLDDALSIEDLGKGVFKVGVHISDVSFFVKQDTDLDKEAKRRANSYFLPHTVYTMLPEILTNNFCKFDVGKEKLAFSIFFKLNNKGELVEDHPELCKSVIKSKCTLPFKLVQDIIEGRVTTTEQFPFSQHPIVDSTFEEIKESILMMEKIASARKKKRLQKGSIFFANQEKLRFRIYEDEHKNPVPMSWEFEQIKEANHMVQEFMLLANVLTAKILLQNYPNLSLLRKNSAPSQFSISKTQSILEKHGNYNIKLNNSKSLAKAIFEIKAIKTLDPLIKDYLNYALMNCLKPSEYVISDQSHSSNHYHHFALNFDLYTHFTSPVRRYPDLIVHRLLTSLIENNPIDEKTTKVDLLNICKKSNKNKENGKLVRLKAEEIFILMILKQKPIITKAFVVDIFQGKLLLYLKEFREEKLIMINYQEFIMEMINEETVIIKENNRQNNPKRKFRNENRDKAVLKSKKVSKGDLIQVKVSSTNYSPIGIDVQVLM